MAYIKVDDNKDSLERPVVNYKELGKIDSFYHSFDPCDYDEPMLQRDRWEPVGAESIHAVRSVSPMAQNEVLVLFGDALLVKLEDLKDLIADVDGAM